MNSPFSPVSSNSWSCRNLSNSCWLLLVTDPASHTTIITQATLPQTIGPPLHVIPQRMFRSRVPSPVQHMPMATSSLHDWPLHLTISGVLITVDNVRKFAPKMFLHLNEAYLPCDIEYCLQGASLRSPSGMIVDNPSQSDLAANADPQNFISMDRVSPNGFPAPGNLINAPYYVAIQAGPDGSFFDMTFFFVFAYNGAQTVRVNLADLTFNASTVSVGEHQGDIECCTVRVDRGFTRVLMVRTEAHGDGTFHSPDSLSFDDTRPVIHCAMSSHATYNAKGMKPNDWISRESLTSALTFVDIVTQSGLEWNPGMSLNLDSIRFVGLDTLGQPIGSESWVKFAGRIGSETQNELSQMNGIGEDLSIGEQGNATAIIVVARPILHDMFPEKLIGNGPTGLATKAAVCTYVPSPYPKSPGTKNLKSNGATPSVIRYRGALYSESLLFAYLMDPTGDRIMVACSEDDGQSWIDYGYTGYDTSFTPQAVAFGDVCVAIYFRSPNSDDIMVCQRNDASGQSQGLCRLPLHCDQQPRAAYDKNMVILLGRSSLTHRCMTYAAGGYIEHGPLPLTNVGTDVGVVIFEECYHVFGTCQDGTIQWITSPDANSWETQSIAVTYEKSLTPALAMSTVAPIVLNGDLLIFYRTNGTNLLGLQFVPSSKTWLVIYDAINDFPADSVPVPVPDNDGGILVFFWEAHTNTMVNIRVPRP